MLVLCYRPTGVTLLSAVACIVDYRRIRIVVPLRHASPVVLKVPCFTSPLRSTAFHFPRATTGYASSCPGPVSPHRECTSGAYSVLAKNAGRRKEFSVVTRWGTGRRSTLVSKATGSARAACIFVGSDVSGGSRWAGSQDTCKGGHVQRTSQAHQFAIYQC